MNNQMMGNMNMNLMGMNSQLMTNYLMDDTAMKIKAIIDPYEQKIIKLEKIIREKDFEITVLKQKIYKYKNNQININMNNQMNMMDQINMNNQMNMMNQINMMNQMNMGWMDNYNMNNNMNMNFLPQNLDNQIMNNMMKDKDNDI